MSSLEKSDGQKALSVMSGESLPTDLQAIQGIPIEPAQRTEIGGRLTGNLLEWTRDRLSSQDRLQFDEHRFHPPDSAVRQRIFAALDGVILEQARTIGPTILFATMVMARLDEWWRSGEDGARKLQRFGEELALGNRARRGKAKLPIDLRLYERRLDLKRELITLQNHLKARYASRRSLPAAPILLGEVFSLISSPEDPFPWLAQNWTSLQLFLHQRPHLITGLVNGASTSTAILDEWLAATMNRDPQTLRQEISKLGSAKPRR